MMIAVVLVTWLGLALVAGGLFIAVIRGGGGTDLPEPALARLDPVALPAQRAGTEHVVRAPVGSGS